MKKRGKKAGTGSVFGVKKYWRSVDSTQILMMVTHWLNSQIRFCNVPTFLNSKTRISYFKSAKRNKKKLCKNASLFPTQFFYTAFMLRQTQWGADICRRIGSGRGSTSQQVQVISMKQTRQKMRKGRTMTGQRCQSIVQLMFMYTGTLKDARNWEKVKGKVLCFYDHPYFMQEFLKETFTKSLIFYDLA